MLAFDRVREKTGRIAGGQRPAEAPGGIPLAILGGPLLETDCEFFDLVERAGGRIVLDATEHGQRTLPRPFDPARVAAEPLEELADAYFDGIPDAFRRPEHASSTSGSAASWPRGKSAASSCIVTFGAISGTPSRND